MIRPLSPKRWKRIAVILPVLAACMAMASYHPVQQPAVAETAVLESSMSKAISTMSTGAEQDVLETGDTAQKRNREIPLSREQVETLAAYSAVPLGSQHYRSAEKCLAQAIYYEAALEPELGQRAVAQIVLNRLRHPAYPDTVCGVVYQGYNQRVCQFSFTCDGSLRRTPSKAHWARASLIAKQALAGYQVDEVGTATHYHADYVVPRWAYTLSKVKTLGRHIFYRFPGGPGSVRSFTARWGGREIVPSIDAARFATVGEESDPVLPETLALVPGLTVTRDVKDRHDPKDVGGRLDTTKPWRLAIPDPAEVSTGYRATVDAHENGGALMPTAAKAGESR